jgi:uncharacterized protein (DUF1697 family)
MLRGGIRAMPGKQVALLRGVNVGGKNKLPMKDLVAMFVEAGCSDVRNFIQSGNILFRAPPRVTTKLPERISQAITAQFGFSAPVILRTFDEMRAVATSNPYFNPQADENLLYVMFLAEAPGDANVAGLDPNRSPPDLFKVQGKEIYMYLTNGAAKTRLTNDYFDRRLATTCTSRNWRTVNTLLELMKE